MTLLQVLRLLAVAVMLAAGQISFKLAAETLPETGKLQGMMRWPALGWLALALGIYAVATLLWVLALSETPLSRAYPFMLVSFTLVPLAAALLFGENIGWNYVLGMALVLAGLGLVMKAGG